MEHLFIDTKTSPLLIIGASRVSFHLCFDKNVQATNIVSYGRLCFVASRLVLFSVFWYFMHNKTTPGSYSVRLSEQRFPFKRSLSEPQGSGDQYKPSAQANNADPNHALFAGTTQLAQTKIRYHKTWHLIWFSAVC